MYNILVVEDELKIAETVLVYLKREGYAASHAATLAEAMAAVGADTDLIVLDLMLPDGRGEDLCRHVAENLGTPVIMLTSKRSEEARISGFASGADDYLTKPFSPRELVARVKSVLKRARPRSKRIRLEGGIEINLDLRAASRNGRSLALTPNEYKVLLCLALNHTRAVERETLVGFLDATEALDRIVDVHVRRLRQKVEEDPARPVIIKTVHGVGYALGVKRLDG